MKQQKLSCLTCLSHHIFHAVSFVAFLLLAATAANAQVLSAPTSTTGRTLPLDLSQITAALSAAPMEFSGAAKSQPLLYNLPMPEGGEQQFRVVESPMMSADFQADFPLIKTYGVVSVGDLAVQGRLTLTPNGFFATILTPNGMVDIHPLDLNNPLLHKVTYEADMEGFECGVSGLSGAATGNEKSAISNGTTRRTYDLAIVTTGEFYNANGGTAALANAVVTATVSGIQAIYDRELAVRFTLLTPFHYTNPATDPFNPGLDRTLEAAQAVEANFPGGNYDIGHVFHETNSGNLGGGGVAFLNAVCNNNPEGTGFQKAGGWSGSFSNSGNGWIRLSGHEFGHMFGMDHTFNGNGDNCDGGNLSLNTAYEIASGTTIMSYNGICGAGQNIPGVGVSDNYFHTNSLTSAVDHIAGQTCHAAAATNNTPPVVNANTCGGTYTIPKSTPFRLTGSGADANGDVIYYAWEQYDEDGAGASPTHGFIGAQAAGSNLAPLFRSYPPTTSPSRTFPNMNLVVAGNYVSDFEPLPSVARTLNFRLFGRDWNANGGGIHCSPLAVTVSNDGPFSVTAPNGNETLTAGTNTTVTWSVANTNNAPVNCANVNIRLSVDGGLTFPYTLAAATPNDGSQSVAIPAGVANSTTARMMVECASNDCVVFFDISNGNFTLTSACLAGASNICPASALSLPAGNAGLNLGLNRYFGSVISSHVVNVTGADPMVPRAMATTENGSTCTTVGTRAFKSFDIAVSTAGTYSFSITSNGFTSVSVFTSAGFNSASPCSSTFFGSNAWDTGGGGASNSGSFNTTMSLSACTLYKVMVYASTAAYGNITVGISGPGEVFLDGTAPAGSYSYTYVAMNTANGQVAAVSATSNFTALAAGSYNVFGASYYSGAGPNPATVNPATWVGQTPAAILAGGSCVLFSSNFKPVTVTGGGGCTPPTVTAPTVTQPTCPTPTGTIVVNATGSGTLEYSVNGGTNWQASNTFSGLAAGNYTLVVRLQANPTCLTNYANNPVVLTAASGCCTAPVVNAPTVTQPTCPTPTGTITVNATGSGTLEYSVNGGTNWQASNTFSGLAAGNHTLVVRLQANPTCLTNYANNPVVLTAASGCGCTVFASTDVPKAISDGMPPITVTSTLNIPASGTITDVNVLNLDVDHTFINDLRIKLKSPANTERILLNQICAGEDNLLINFDDESPNSYASIPCPPNAVTHQPNQALSPFDGQNLNGVWTLTIEDLVNQDGGSLQAWSLEVCYTNSCTPPVINSVTVTPANCNSSFGGILVNATGVSALEYTIDDGAFWSTSANFENFDVGSYTVKVRLQNNPTCMTTYANNPVVIGIPACCPPTSQSTGTPTQPTCAVPTGSFTTSASGGNGPWEFSINNGASYQASGTFSGLAPGTYLRKIRSIANPSCIFDQSNVVINAVPTPPAVTVPTVTQPTCAVPTGTIVVNATGGGTLEYSVNGGTNWQTSATFSGLAAGSYTLVVRLQANPTCLTNYASNPVVLTAASGCGCTPPVVTAPTFTQPPCGAGVSSVEVVVNATGSGTLEYSMDNGTSWQTSNTFFQFPGSYNIKVRLQASPTCMTAYSGNPVVIAQPACCPPTSQSTLIPSPTCTTSGFTTSASGGSGPWEYSINNGASYQTSGTFSGLAPGTYLRKIRAVNLPSCIFDQSNVVISPPPTPPALTAPTLTQPTCATPTGTVVVNATGGSTLEYSVNNGTTWQTSNTFSGLAPGNYFIKVRLQLPNDCMTAYASNPVVLNVPTGCCPLPTYSNTCASGDFIQDFTFGTFSNLNTGCANPGVNNLSNYLGTGPNVNAGATYQVTVKAGPDFEQHIGLYIDLNGNGSYLDMGEFFNIGQAPANSTVSASVQIPANTPLGTKTMRVRSSYDNPLIAADGCGTNLGWGEMEDYSIYIFCESPPGIFAVLDQQPINCADPSSGDIDVIGFGLGGTVQFSIDNGASWQLDHYFPGLPGGNYNVKISYVSDPTCVTTYNLNPVVFDAAGGPLYGNQCTSGNFIQDFSFGTFSNLNTGCSNPSNNNLTNYLGIGPIVQVGETYPVTIKAGPDLGQHYAIYIDFDQNGSYLDAGEFFNIGQALPNSTVTTNVTIPVGTFTGTRKMRVRSAFNVPLTAADGCNTTLSYGEMEDYNIYIYCPNNLTLNAVPIPGGVYDADVQLSSAGRVNNGTSVLFRAGTSVDLMPNFEVQLGGLFEVLMQGCF